MAARVIAFGGIAVLAMTLGYAGLTIYLRGHPGFGHSSADIIYYDLQLFLLAAEPVNTGVRLPVLLQISRFLAPVVTTYAVIEACAALLENKRQELRARLARHHVVVCNGNIEGQLIAGRLRQEGRKVVLVEAAPGPELLASCRRQKTMLVVGDARNSDVLRNAGLAHADELYVVARDSSVNTAIVVVAHGLTRTRSRPIHCFASIEDRYLRAALTARHLSLSREGGFELDLFSIAEIGVHMLLDRHMLDTLSEDPSNVAVFGLDDFGQALVVELARRWRGSFHISGRRLEMTLVDESARLIWERLKSQFSFIDQVCEATPVTADPETIQLPSSQRPAELRDSLPPINCVSISDQEKALKTALAMLHIGQEKKFDVIVRVDANSHDLDEAFHSVSYMLFDDADSSLRIFGLLETACDPTLIRQGVAVEAIARALHSDYIALCRTLDETPQVNASMRPWAELPECLRESNRSQARHVGKKLRSIDCSLVPYFDSSYVFAFRTAPDEVEQLARLEHDRWMQERLALGVVYGPRRDELHHPDLVDWDQLSPAAREKDRHFITTLPHTLADAGYQILRGRQTK